MKEKIGIVAWTAILLTLGGCGYKAGSGGESITVADQTDMTIKGLPVVTARTAMIQR